MSKMIAEPSTHIELMKEMRNSLANMKYKVNFCTIFLSFTFISGRLGQIPIVKEGLVHACRTK